MKKLIVTLLLLIIANVGYANETDSIYTKLSGKECQRVDEDSIKCPGVGGYKLIVQEGDSRISLVVVTPNNKEYPLNFWDVVTGHLTSIGKNAEWRVNKTNGKVVPAAIIVRLKVYPWEEGEKAKSLLVISKITNNEICVTDKIDGQRANANQLARSLADHSQGKSCLQE